MRFIADTNGGPNQLAAEGWHFVRVKDCREKKSRAGDDYFNLELVEAATGDHVTYDVTMLAGPGTEIGLGKLKALGAASRNPTDDGWNVASPDEVIGRCAYTYIWHEDHEWNGERRVRTSVSIKHGTFGYSASTDAPPGPLAGPPPPTGDEIPF